MFEFVQVNPACYPVALMCRMLGGSPSGHYAWCKRGPSKRALSDATLTERIEAIYRWSNDTYGAPRMHDHLCDEGIRVGKKRVARLMRAAGLVGVSRRKGVFTTRRDKEAIPAPDLVKRDFTADGPDRLWLADMTYISTWSGYLYLWIVLEVYSRRIVGWQMALHLRCELVIDALNMALMQRHAYGVIHHSDQGSQYTSIAFGDRCEQAGVTPSMGSAGDCYDNAMCESFFATLECELLDRRRFRTQSEARMAVFEYIKGGYNLHRKHSALGYRSPVQFERSYQLSDKIASP